MADDTRSVRIPDDLWDKFDKATRANFTNRSAAIVQFVNWYVQKWEMSTGVLSPELMEVVSSEISNLVRSESTQILAKVFNLITTSEMSDDLLDMMGNSQQQSNMKDLL